MSVARVLCCTRLCLAKMLTTGIIPREYSIHASPDFSSTNGSIESAPESGLSPHSNLICLSTSDRDLALIKH
jgi:hypothetical protein